MLSSFKSIRAAFAVSALLVIAACSQTNVATSTYSGVLGKPTVSDKQRKAKILAARKRAGLKREKARKAFIKKRETARQERLSRIGSKKKKPSAKKKTVRKSKSKKHKVTKTAKKRTKKVYTGKISGTTYAYVGGRSKGVVKNRKPWRCVPKRLKVVIAQISKKFGRVVINSTHRSSRHNRLVGGKRRSYHLRCQAVDFRVRGKTRGLTRWLARHPYVGGFKRYRSGYYHIDTGPKRTW